MNEKTFLVNIKRQLKKDWKHVKRTFGHAGEFLNHDQVKEMFYLMNIDMSDAQFDGLIKGAISCGFYTIKITIYCVFYTENHDFWTESRFYRDLNHVFIEI